MKKIMLSLFLILGLVSNVNASQIKLSKDQQEQQSAINTYLNSDKPHEIAKSIMIFEKHSLKSPLMLYYFGLANIEGKTNLLDLNEKTGENYIEQASVLGSPEARYHIAMKKMKDGDLSGGIEDLKAAALKNERNSQYRLGKMYYQGNGIPKSKINGFKLIQASAKQGNSDAQYDLAKIYFSQKELAVQKNGIYWLKEAVVNGKKEACSDLYKIYDAGLLVDKNIYMHKKFLNCSAQYKNEEAMLLLASYYENGIYMKKNEAIANKIYIDLKAIGNVTGIHKSALYVVKNKPSNTRELSNALRTLSGISRDNIESAQLLANIYKTGYHSIKKNKDLAIKYFNQAKRLGDPDASKEIVLLLNQ